MIRSALETDANVLWELANEAHRESRYHKYPMDYPTVNRLLQASVAQPKHYCLKVAEQEGKIVGFIVGFCVGAWFNLGGPRFAHDLMLYVQPAKRSTTAPLHLVRAFETWATAEAGADEVWLATTTGVKPEQTGQFYDRLGFSRVGSIHVKNAQDVRKPQHTSPVQPA